MTGDGADAHVATEQELASIVASSHDAILGMTAAGTITSCNPAAGRLYGYLPAELVGSAVEVLVLPSLRAAEAAVLARIAAGDEVEPYRADRVRQDGTVVTVLVTASLVLDADGRVVGVATAVRRPVDVQDAADPVRERVSQRRASVRGAEDRFQLRMEAERAKERVQVQDAEDRFQVGLEGSRARERREVEDAEDRFQVGLDADRARERADVQNVEDRVQIELDVERAEARSDLARLESQLQQGQRLEILCSNRS